jgi:peptide/nickel transport system permease protein
MLAYVARRLVLAAITVWAISVLSWVIIQLPEGDLVDQYFEALMLGSQSLELDSTQAETMRKYLGLDQPLMYRYMKWVWGLLQGDLGRSFAGTYAGGTVPRAEDVPVRQIIGDRLFLTVVLTGFTILVTWSFAIPVGVYSAIRQHSVGDYALSFLGFVGLAVPDFLLGLVLMYLAFAYFDMSVGGLFSGDYMNAPWSMAKVNDLLKHLWVPAVVLGTSGTAGLIRIMRNNLLDELNKPYVVTATAKGVSPFRVIIKYPVRVAINPLISTVGYLLPTLVGGSVIVSVVLSLPTMGPLLLDGIVSQDPYLAGFIVLMLGVLTVAGTLVSDILLAIVDPRIRFVGR